MSFGFQTPGNGFAFHRRESILKLKDEFYKPRDLAEDDELENIVDAILKQKAMAMDTGYVADLVKFMYRFKNSQQQSVATDVFALDILRGRDHGLNKFLKYLGYCTNSIVSDWAGLRDFIDQEVRDAEADSRTANNYFPALSLGFGSFTIDLQNPRRY